VAGSSTTSAHRTVPVGRAGVSSEVAERCLGHALPDVQGMVLGYHQHGIHTRDRLEAHHALAHICGKTRAGKFQIQRKIGGA
jgi:hypothetical protein